MPLPGRGPRSTNLSRSLASRRNVAVGLPAVVSGCFKTDSRGAGAKPLLTIAAINLSKASRRGRRHALAGRIVDLNIPTPQFRGDPTREDAVRGNERRGFFFGLQRVPENEGDDAGLLRRVRAIDTLHARQSIGRYFAERPPRLRGFGRPHGLGDKRRCAATAD